MAADDKDADETTVLENEVQEGEPVIIRMPVDIRSVTLTVIATLGGILVLQYAKPVFIPVILGTLISYVLGPAVTSMAKHGIPRFLGAFVVIAALCGALGYGVYTLSDEVVDIIDDVPRAAQKLRDRVKASRRGGGEEGLLSKVQSAATQIDQAAADATKPVTTQPGAQAVQIVEPAFSATDYVWAGGRRVLSGLAQFAVVLFLVYFLLVTDDLYKRKIVKIAGPTLTKKKISVQIMDEINQQISGFLRVAGDHEPDRRGRDRRSRCGGSASTTTSSGVCSPGSSTRSPTSDPIVVTGGLGGRRPSCSSTTWCAPAYVSGTALAITSLEGWLLTPLLMSRAAQMNPVAIFVGLLFWSWVWGVWGTILAVPMLMVIKAVCDRVEDLQPIGELLGE